MEKEIFAEKESIGRAVFTPDGGGTRVEAVCPYREGIWRLYLTEKEHYYNLGVLMPEGGSLTLRRRIPRALPGLDPEKSTLCILPGVQTPQYEAPEKTQQPEQTQQPEETPVRAENRPEDWESPPAGMLDRWCACPAPSALTSDALLIRLLNETEEALYSYRGGGIELAIPAERMDAISAVLCLTRTERIRDREYFVLSLDDSGTPAPAMPSSRY